jgi:hypothetical protein
MTVCPYCRQVDSHACNCWHPNPQSVPTCTCSKHPLWDGYDGDCPIHGWFEPVSPDTPQSVPAKCTQRDKLKERVARLEKELRESLEENLWDAYSRGIERDGKWTTAGMSDAEWLARIVGLDPHARHAHDAETVKQAIPKAAERLVAEIK